MTTCEDPGPDMQDFPPDHPQRLLMQAYARLPLLPERADGSKQTTVASFGAYDLCLSELSPKLYRHLARLGGALAAGLAAAARAAGVAMQVNAFGSLVTPFFTSQPVRDYQSAAAADTAAYAAFSARGF